MADDGARSTIAIPAEFADLKELMEKQGLLAIVIGFVILIGVLAIMQHVGKRALAAAGL